MSEIRKGCYMHTSYSGPCNDEETWSFPKGFEGVDDDTYYEIEYDYYSPADPMDQSCTYRVTSIKPISKLMQNAYEIIQKYKYMQTHLDEFENWLRDNYEIERI